MAEASETEVPVAETQAVPFPRPTSVCSTASAASNASTNSFESIDIPFNFDGSNREETVEKLRKWVQHKSRRLSMSKGEREQFEIATSKYFAELNSTLNREAVTLEMETVATDDCASSCAQEDSPSISSEQDEVINTLEESVQCSDKRTLCMPQNECLFIENSREHIILNEAVQGFSNDDDDNAYFLSVEMVRLQAYMRYLLMLNLEMDYTRWLLLEDETKVRETWDLMKSIHHIFTKVPPSQYFRVLQLVSLRFNSNLQNLVREIEERVSSMESNNIHTYDNLLSSCVDAFCQRSEAEDQVPLQLDIDKECCICLLSGVIVIKRDCCDSMMCISCFSEWVTSQVLTRNIEVGCPCCETYLTTFEILEFLGEKKERYHEIMTDINGSSSKKTCPQCNMITERPDGKPRKRNGGHLVNCQRCQFSWCFRCHSPLHIGITCSANSSGKHQLREWGVSTYNDGSERVRKARRCPNCKVWIEKNQGCNHMTCSNCHYEFCYICGKSWRAGNLIYGHHSNRFSIFGCKNKLLPHRPILRKLVRGTLFVLESIGIVIGAPIVLGLLLALSPILGIVGLGVLIYQCRS